MAESGRVRVHVRSGRLTDLPALTATYNWYVSNTAVTFDEVEASLADRETWFGAFAPSGPHRLLVAEVDGVVVGCASSSPYRSHPAFARTVEAGIYLDPQSRGQGLGRRLYDELLSRLESEAVHLVVAGVALPNDASVGLHLSRGFRHVGTFTEYAMKGERLISSSWFERLMHG